MQKTFVTAADVIADGFVFAESPRWHDNDLHLADMMGRSIWRLGPDGSRKRVVLVEADGLGGISFDASGTLYYLTERPNALWRLDAGTSILVAELGDVAPHGVNDLAVSPDGYAFIGIRSSAPFPDAHPEPLICVGPDGELNIALRHVLYANGMAISRSGKSFWLAESAANRVSRYALSGACLSGPELVIDVPGGFPDGVCLDRSESIWVAAPKSGMVLKFDTEGRCAHQVTMPHGIDPTACAIGGANDETLFITAFAPAASIEEMQAGRRSSVYAIPMPIVESASHQEPST